MSARIKVIPFARTIIKHQGGISLKLLEQMFKFLPHDAALVGAYSDSTRNVFGLVFESSTWDEVPVAGIIPEAIPMFTKQRDGTVECDYIDFGTHKTILPGSKQACQHDYVDYHGFNTSYRHCKHCGQKEAP